MTEQVSQVSQLDTWRNIQGLLDTYEWTDRFNTALPAQREAFKRRIDAAISRACEAFNLVGPDDYPAVSEGNSRPKAPDGKTYFDDWFKAMREAAIQQHQIEKSLQTPA